MKKAAFILFLSWLSIFAQTRSANAVMTDKRLQFQYDVTSPGNTGTWTPDSTNSVVVNANVRQLVGTVTVKPPVQAEILAVIIFQTPFGEWIAWTGEFFVGTQVLNVTLPEAIYVSTAYVVWASYNETEQMGYWEIQVVLH